MNGAEFAIIYFSIGCAVSAHYFFKSPALVRSYWKTRFRAIIVASLWPLYLLNLAFTRNAARLSAKDFEVKAGTDSNESIEIFAIQRQIESMLISPENSSLLFEFRNTISRYAGLSAAATAPVESKQFHILELGNTPSLETQHICLNRRNRQRLLRHHNEARTEFIESIALLLKDAEDHENVGRAVIEFVKLLDDSVAEARIESIIELTRQTRQTIPVNTMENQTWIPQEQ